MYGITSLDRFVPLISVTIVTFVAIGQFVSHYTWWNVTDPDQVNYYYFGLDSPSTESLWTAASRIAENGLLSQVGAIDPGEYLLEWIKKSSCQVGDIAYIQ